MKKRWLNILLLVFLVVFPRIGLADSQVNSQVGIRFYQPTSAHQIVPMEKFLIQMREIDQLLMDKRSLKKLEK